MTFLLLASGAERALLGQGSGPDIPWFRLILAFLFCIGLAVVAIMAVRARAGMPVLPNRLSGLTKGLLEGEVLPQERVTIIQRLPVAPGSQLILLKRGRQRYLLHLTASGATEIDRFTEEPEADA